jgi:hypothetical protein
LEIHELCDDPNCVLRIRRIAAPHTAACDGQTIQRGEPIIEIHLWNERIPPMPADGPDLAWAVQMQRLLVGSFRMLARQVQSDPQLAGARAIVGMTSMLAPRDRPGGLRLMEHLGFTVLPYHNPLGRFGEFWENFYTWWIMWTYNQASLRHRRLFRLVRAEVWMTMAELLSRYGTDN